MSANALSQHYADQVQHLQEILPEGLPEWLAGRRRGAAVRFAEAGFPDPRMEEWKYTNVRPIATKPFVAAAGDADVSADTVRALGFDGLDAYRMVFVDGRLRRDLSNLAGLPEGAVVQGLGEALATDPDPLEPFLATLAHDRFSSFAALNTAFMNDGAVVRLAPGVRLERPLHLLLLGSAGDAPTWSHPRVLIQAGEGAEATVIEHYADLPGANGFTNTVTELRAEAGARVRHYLLQDHADGAYHVGSVFVQQRRDSRVTSHNVNLGGRLVRHDLNVDLTEPGAEIELLGLFLAGGRQHVDTHTRVHHLSPHTTSRERYRGIGQGHGRGVFKGRVLVDQGAQKTDAQQHSANLLLSPNAEIDTKPELEIYADDVKCAHGATVGQLDETSLYYLRSRGIGEAEAREMLVFAFADEVLESMDLEPLRANIEARLAARLPGGMAMAATAPA
ncbi:Fe-S cluster assembly protein SufD [Thioalkalivibrio paradoxus]|uniref:FeS assembly protein SufD n=1 Tax=Thioalkalivibrio paradoxus ARh 1 TaxID=713585 RepID=W0DHJ2_9GAMM|nr:Fe-S cluster assembly protein SufD [Thioalkalivibrio paradoxus]AHE98099.1 FeS assembly protein SufD [Thioalkalivibrio paradoxus ARh 1]